jgi:MFS family permease
MLVSYFMILLGRRRVFVCGLVVFSTASLLIGLAPERWWAIAGPSGRRARKGVTACTPTIPSA